MLTVKKFANIFDLTLGGYFSGFIGIILALLTILELPPDMINADDDDDDNNDSDDDGSTDSSLTTVASITELSTESEITVEKKDELNDSGLTMSIFTLITSCIGIIMLMVYLFSDKDQIIKELSDQNPAMKESLKDHSTSTTVISVIVLILLVMNVIASVNMILGINKYQPKRMMPFLCSIGFTLLFTIAATIMNYEKPLFYASLTLVVILIYFGICTYALRLELEKREYRETDAECATEN
ncbi:unnamed protein product [Diamesa serratosioi]